MALYFNSGLLTIHSQYHRLSLFLYTVVVVSRDIDRNTRGADGIYRMGQRPQSHGYSYVKSQPVFKKIVEDSLVNLQ